MGDYGNSRSSDFLLSPLSVALDKDYGFPWPYSLSSWTFPTHWGSPATLAAFRGLFLSLAAQPTAEGEKSINRSED